MNWNLVLSLQLNITNHGLIIADNMGIQLPNHPFLEISTVALSQQVILNLSLLNQLLYLFIHQGDLFESMMLSTTYIVWLMQ